MRDDLLDCTVLRNEITSCLVTDTAHSGHVIRRIAHQGEIVGYVSRGNTKPFVRVLGADPLFFDSGRSATTRVQEPHAGTDELLEVLVARDNHHVYPRGYALGGECANDIIGLVALKRQNANVVCVE